VAPFLWVLYGSILISIGDRGYEFFVGVLEFCSFWFGLLVLGLLWVVDGRLSQNYREEM